MDPGFCYFYKYLLATCKHKTPGTRYPLACRKEVRCPYISLSVSFFISLLFVLLSILTMQR